MSVTLSHQVHRFHSILAAFFIHHRILTDLIADNEHGSDLLLLLVCQAEVRRSACSKCRCHEASPQRRHTLSGHSGSVYDISMIGHNLHILLLYQIKITLSSFLCRSGDKNKNGKAEALPFSVTYFLHSLLFLLPCHSHASKKHITFTHFSLCCKEKSLFSCHSTTEIPQTKKPYYFHLFFPILQGKSQISLCHKPCHSHL